MINIIPENKRTRIIQKQDNSGQTIFHAASFPDLYGVETLQLIIRSKTKS